MWQLLIKENVGDAGDVACRQLRMSTWNSKKIGYCYNHRKDDRQGKTNRSTFPTFRPLSLSLSISLSLSPNIFVISSLYFHWYLYFQNFNPWCIWHAWLITHSIVRMRFGYRVELDPDLMLSLILAVVYRLPSHVSHTKPFFISTFLFSFSFLFSPFFLYFFSFSLSLIDLLHKEPLNKIKCSLPSPRKWQNESQPMNRFPSNTNFKQLNYFVQHST